MLSTINLTVNGQGLSGTSIQVASNLIEEINCAFTFQGTDWTGFDEVSAIFQNKQNGIVIEKVLVNNACTVPSEVLAKKGEIQVNLCAYTLNSTTQLKTLQMTSYKTKIIDVLQKVNVEGENSNPTPEIWRVELMAEQQARQSADTALSTRITTIEGKETSWDAKVDEAPDDGKQYARKNKAWSEVTVTSGVASVNGKTGVVTLNAQDVGAITDAPSDNKEYARKNGAWTEVVGGVQSVNGKTGVVTLTTNDLTNDSGYITKAVNDLTNYRTSSAQDVIDEDMQDAIDAIEELIPTQATSSNQLADKNFVNSSIATETAHYISNNGQPFTSVEQLEAYSGTVTNNDYAIVTGVDASGNTYFDRYKATVPKPAEASSIWAKEYRINNSSFTAVQWASINSGVTSALIASYNAHIASTSNPHNVTKAQVGLGNVDNTSDLNKPISTATQSALDAKQNTLVSGTNIKTINNQSVLGSGNIDISGIFIATYGVTPIEQIKAAYQSGKDILCVYNDGTYNVCHLIKAKLYDEASEFEFSSTEIQAPASSGTIAYFSTHIKVSSWDGWYIVSESDGQIFTTINALVESSGSGSLASQSSLDEVANTRISCYETMPTGMISADVGWIVQYQGETDSNYTNGYFYKCVESSGSYIWQRIDIQPHQDISGKEDKSNKVTSFGATPSDDKYPSEKLVKDSLDAKAELPTIVNDRYLHTNASTGNLEWAEGGGGGGNLDLSIVDGKLCVTYEEA